MKKQVGDCIQGKLPKAPSSTKFSKKLSGVKLNSDIYVYCYSKQI